MSMQGHYSTLAALRQAIFVVEAQPPDYPITFVNAALCSLTGYEAEDLVGKSCAVLFGNPDETGLAREQLASALLPPPGETARGTPQESKLARLFSVSEIQEADQRYYIAMADGADSPPPPADMGKIVHELRGPLSACVAWIDLLELKLGNSPELGEALAAIKRNLERQGRLLDDLASRLRTS